MSWKTTTDSTDRERFLAAARAMLDEGAYSVQASDGWAARYPGSERQKTAWLRYAAAELGGRWVPGYQVKSGRGAFGRLGGSGLRSEYRPGYVTRLPMKGKP